MITFLEANPWMTVYELASKYLVSQIFLISWTQWNVAAWIIDSANLSSSAFTYVLLASHICSQYAFLVSSFSPVIFFLVNPYYVQSMIE